MFLQHLARGLQVTRVAHHGGQAFVFDLRHVDGGVPCGHQSRGADGRRNLRRQGVHVVAVDRAFVRVGIEVEATRLRPQRLFGRLQERMAVGDEGVFIGPDFADDLQAGVIAVRVETNQTTARPERFGQWRDDLAGLEFDGCAGAVRLRGDNQVKISAHTALLRAHVVQEQLVVFSVDHQHHRALVSQAARGFALFGRPVAGEEGLQIGDLFVEGARGVALQGHLTPFELACRRQ